MGWHFTIYAPDHAFDEMNHVLDAQEPAKKHNFDLAIFYGASRADIQSSAPPSVLKGPQQPPFTPANGSLRTLGFETGRFVVLGHSVLRSPPTSSEFIWGLSFPQSRGYMHPTFELSRKSMSRQEFKGRYICPGVPLIRSIVPFQRICVPGSVLAH